MTETVAIEGVKVEDFGELGHTDMLLCEPVLYGVCSSCNTDRVFLMHVSIGSQSLRCSVCHQESKES